MLDLGQFVAAAFTVFIISRVFLWILRWPLKGKTGIVSGHVLTNLFASFIYGAGSNGTVEQDFQSGLLVHALPTLVWLAADLWYFGRTGRVLLQRRRQQAIAPSFQTSVAGAILSPSFTSGEEYPSMILPRSAKQSSGHSQE